MEKLSSKGKMSVDLRVSYEELSAEALIAAAKTRELIESFWATLQEKHPDLSKLVIAGTNISSSLKVADATYKALLEVAPQNTGVMR